MDAAPRLTLPGWYAAWIPLPAGGRDRRVVFGFRDQELEFVVEVGRRFVALADPVLAGARLVGPFRSPEGAQAALYLSSQAGRREALRA
jgi:hypothetical protein